MRYGALVLIVIHAHPAVAQTGALGESVRLREDAFREAVFELEVTEFVAKGQLGIPDSRTKDGGVRPPGPGADVEVKATSRLVYGKGFVRFENNQPLWAPGTNEFLPSRSVVVATPELGKQYFPMGISGQGRPRAILGGGAPEAVRPPVLTPLHIHCRGATAGVTPYLLTEAVRTESVLTIGGAKCQEYLMPAASDKTVSVLVDEGAGHTVRRIRKMKQGKLTQQADITYRPVGNGSVPASWVITEIGPSGQLVRKLSVAASLTSRHTGLPTSERELVLPEGCNVYDQRTRAEYVVRADGMMREVDERGDGGLVVPQPDAPWHQRHRGVLLCAVAAAIAGSALAVVYRRKLVSRRRVTPAA